MNGAMKLRGQEQGFTLVELAIVMIIIGLLIAGILKGQELIINARVASTVAQVKGIDAATTTFRDKYAGMPGDLSAAATRLPPACGAGVACANGNGNNRVDGNVPGAVPTGENIQFFQQLNAADLLSGINPALGAVTGGFYPAANIAGAFNAAYTAGNVALATATAPAANVRAGHYLTLVQDAAVANAAGNVAVSPNQSSRIDIKLDDGTPQTGSVLAGGTLAATGCLLTATAYNEAVDGTLCSLYIRFNQ